MAAACGHIHRIGSALQAKDITVMQAKKILSQMGCSRVQLEMDTSILKNGITSMEYDLAPLGGHFKEIKALMCNAFEDINVSVCKRSCNIVAHNLAARVALLGDSNQEIWIADLPQFVIDLCKDNMSSTMP